MLIHRRTALALAGSAFAVPVARAAGADTLAIALAARQPGTLLPSATTLGADNWACRQIYDTLAVPEDGTFATTPAAFRPSLAERWDTSADSKTWTFHLRPGVPWQKGYGILSADDVLFTYRRLLDPAALNSNRVLYDNIADVSVPGDGVVQFRLKRPDPLFIGSAVYTTGGNILCRRAWNERGDRYASDPVGTGAYQFERIDPARGVMLSGFTEHWAGAPATPNLQVLYILDTTARTLAFLSGQADIIEGVRTPGWLPSIRARKPDTIFDATRPGSVNTLHLNLTRKPLDDLRVRQAIRHAIDGKALAGAYGELGQQSWGINPPMFPGSVSPANLPPDLLYPFDPGRARALLAEAGLGGGVHLPCFTSQREDFSSIMLIVKEMLRKVGITLDLNIIDHASMHADNRKDLNTVALQSSSYPPVPTQALLEQLTSAATVKADGTGGTNYSHYGAAIPGVDALLTRVQDEPDFDKRVALCREVEMRVLRDLPVLGLLDLSYVTARNPRVDLGYTVQSGYAYWPLRRAKIKA